MPSPRWQVSSNVARKSASNFYTPNTRAPRPRRGKDIYDLPADTAESDTEQGAVAEVKTIAPKKRGRPPKKGGRKTKEKETETQDVIVVAEVPSSPVASSPMRNGRGWKVGGGEEEAEEDEEEGEEDMNDVLAAVTRTTRQPRRKPQEEPPAPPAEEKRGRGRPKGTGKKLVPTVEVEVTSSPRATTHLGSEVSKVLSQSPKNAKANQAILGTYEYGPPSEEDNTSEEDSILERSRVLLNEDGTGLMAGAYTVPDTSESSEDQEEEEDGVEEEEEMQVEVEKVVKVVNLGSASVDSTDEESVDEERIQDILSFFAETYRESESATAEEATNGEDRRGVEQLLGQLTWQQTPDPENTKQKPNGITRETEVQDEEEVEEEEMVESEEVEDDLSEQLELASHQGKMELEDSEEEEEDEEEEEQEESPIEHAQPSGRETSLDLENPTEEEEEEEEEEEPADANEVEQDEDYRPDQEPAHVEEDDEQDREYEDLRGAIDPLNVFMRVGRLVQNHESRRPRQQAAAEKAKEANRVASAAREYAAQQRMEEDNESDVEDSDLPPSLVSLRNAVRGESSALQRLDDEFEFSRENDLETPLIQLHNTESRYLVDAQAALDDFLSGSNPSDKDLHAISFIHQNLENMKKKNDSLTTTLKSALRNHQRRIDMQKQLAFKVKRLLRQHDYIADEQTQQLDRVQRFNATQLRKAQEQLQQQRRQKQREEEEAAEILLRHREEQDRRKQHTLKRKRHSISVERRVRPAPNPTPSSGLPSMRSSIASDQLPPQASWTSDPIPPPLLDRNTPSSEDIWLDIATTPAPIIGRDAPIERVSIEGFGHRSSPRSEHSDSLILEDHGWSIIEERVLSNILLDTVDMPHRFVQVKRMWDERRARGREELRERGRDDLLARARFLKKEIIQNLDPNLVSLSWLQGF